MLVLTSEQRVFLDAARVGHLGTANENGAPHVVPVCYAVLDDGAFILIDRKQKQFEAPDKLKRVMNLQSNPQACLTVDRYDEDWSRLGFVMLRGTASLISDGPQYRAAMETLMRRYPQYREQQLQGRPMISIEICKVSSWGRLAD